uniref:Uncharacterized protein n=1 Tax=Heterorhabditis bacteriophora TaxID=37862 RepID=A0A1I7XI97_HETBA
MFHSKATISNPERLAELTAYLYELLEWGTKGPPGGFSISKIPRFVAPVSNEQRKKRVKRAQHFLNSRRRNRTMSYKPVLL